MTIDDFTPVTSVVFNSSDIAIAGIFNTTPTPINRFYCSVSETVSSPVYRVARYSVSNFLPASLISTLATFTPVVGNNLITFTEFTPGISECFVIEYSSGTIGASNYATFTRSGTSNLHNSPVTFNRASSTWSRFSSTIPRFGPVHTSGKLVSAVYAYPDSDLTLSTDSPVNITWIQLSPGNLCEIGLKFRHQSTSSVALVRVKQENTTIYEASLTSSNVGANQSTGVIHFPVDINLTTGLTYSIELTNTSSPNNLIISREKLSDVYNYDLPGIIYQTTYPVIIPKIIPVATAPSPQRQLFNIIEPSC